MKTLILAILILTAPSLAQTREQRPARCQVTAEDRAIDAFSERLTELLADQQTNEYRLTRAGKVSINGSVFALDWTGISEKTKRMMIRNNGAVQTPCRKGK